MSANRLHRLRAFLAEGASLPFVWGRCDCSLWACDWIAAERGVDPAEGLRGAYASARGCARLLAREGGLSALAGRLGACAGLIETDAPEPGDVGLAEHDAGGLLMLHIAGPTWAWKTREGIVLAPASALRVWAV